MKNRLYYLAIAILIIMLAANVSASSINAPVAVFQGQSFRIMFGDMDCSGGPCNITWTSPSGADDGDRWENAGGTDPDSAIKGWYTFDEEGVYNMSIYTCPGSTCPATPDNSYMIQVINPATLDQEDQVDVQWRYSANTVPDKLFIQGYAPSDATHVALRFNKMEGGSATWPPPCVAVDNADEPEFSTILNPRADGWENTSYWMYATYHNDSSCSFANEVGTRAYGYEFNYLEILSIWSQLELLEAQLNGTNATLQAQIDDLYNITYNMSTDIAAIQYNIDALENMIDAMNHGTIMLDYYVANGSESLAVTGEAPEGAKSAMAVLSPYTGYNSYKTVLEAYVNNVTQNGSNPNWYGLSFDVTGNTDPLKVSVYFFSETEDLISPLSTLVTGGTMSGRHILNGTLNTTALNDDPASMNVYYTLSAQFIDQYVFWLGSQVDMHESWLENTTLWLDDLNDTVDNHSEQLDQIWTHLEEINTSITTINANISELYNLTAEQQEEIDNLTARLDSLNDSLTALQTQVDLMNHGDVDLVWNEGAMNLRAKIKFPLGATHAELMAYDQDDNLAYTYPTSIIPEADNYKNVDWDVSAWDKQAYTIKVKFMNDSGAKVDRWATALFDGLWIMWLEERIDTVEDDLYGYPLLDGIVWDVVNNTCASEGYTADNCTIETFCQISVNNGPMASFFTEMTPAEAIWFSTFLGIDDMTTLNYVWNACEQVQIWKMGETIYGDGEEEFAEAARYGFCSWREELNETEGVYPNLCNDSNAEQNWLDTLTDLGLDDRINVLAGQFYSDSVDQWQNITGLWDQVWLLWNEVHSIWAAIEDLENMSLITFDYLSPRYGGPSLDLSGYAPGDAQSVQVWFSGLHSGAFYSRCIPTVDQAASPEFSREDIDLSSWEVDSYIIQGVFLNESGCNGHVVNPEARIIFDSLLDDWLHENELGFDLMDTQTFEVWNPQESFTRKMSWAFTAPKDGWYWFELVNPTSDNGEDISKEFAGGTSYWINSHETKYFKNRNVRFPPEEGSYKVKLKAHNAFTGETIKSNAFRLIIDDLARPWPNNTAGVREISIANYSNASSIYWTSHTIVNAVADLISDYGWANTTGCHVNYWNRSIAPWVLVKDGTNATCSGPIRLTNDEPGAASAALTSGETSRITICGTPVVGDVSYAEVCADVTLGFDDTPPVIDEETLNPGTLDAVHGVWNFSADVTDDGEIESVRFTLTNKSNASQVCPLGDANNTVGDTWVVAYNTTGNCTPDGYYNFTVYAVDYAGNEVNLTIDPIVDNTPPEVDWLNMSGYFGKNGGYTIKSHITDNLAGVESAYAVVQAFGCEDFVDRNCSVSWCEESDPVCTTEPETLNETPIACAYNSDCSENATCDNGTCMIKTCEDAPEDCSFESACAPKEVHTTIACQGGWCKPHFVTVEDCVADCAEDNESCINGCYGEYCDLSKDATSSELSCDTVCYADECTFEKGQLIDEPFTVNLSRTSGTVLDGNWMGTLNGSELSAGTQYHVKIVARDAAGNQNEENNSNTTAIDFYSDVGYSITIDVPDKADYNAEFTVNGEVTATDGSTPTGSVTISPWNVERTLLLGDFAYKGRIASSGDKEITATYAPVCGEINIASDTITIGPRPNGGGGGGGGYFDQGNSDGGNHTESNFTVKKNKEPTQSSDGGVHETTTGNNESSGTNESVVPEKPDQNLVTGAVTGGGFFSGLAWLWILLGVIVVLLGLWLIVKKK